MTWGSRSYLKMLALMIEWDDMSKEFSVDSVQFYLNLPNVKSGLGYHR